MKLIQLLGKYSSVSQGMNARAYSLKERESNANDMFFPICHLLVQMTFPNG